MTAVNNSLIINLESIVDTSSVDKRNLFLKKETSPSKDGVLHPVREATCVYQSER